MTPADRKRIKDRDRRRRERAALRQLNHPDTDRGEVYRIAGRLQADDRARHVRHPRVYYVELALAGQRLAAMLRADGDLPALEAIGDPDGAAIDVTISVRV